MLITPEFWSALAAIVVIDLVLAGDNAIVIALAARNLPKALQRRAVLWGTLGAVVVRASLTVAVLWLLQVPGLMLAGGVLLVWIACVAAVARPQIIEPPLTKTVPKRDLLLAVDLSGSMDTKDFKNAQGETVDRLTAVKEVLDDFLTKRAGDRVGLIFFGSAPFVQAPFTEDLKVCRQLLDEALRTAGPRAAVYTHLALAHHGLNQPEMAERFAMLAAQMPNKSPRESAELFDAIRTINQKK